MKNTENIFLPDNYPLNSNEINSEKFGAEEKQSLTKSSYNLKNAVLVTDISHDSFKYICIAQKKEKIELIDYGDLSKDQLRVTSEDPLDLHRAGLAWIEGNSNASVKDILIVSSQLDFFVRKLELPLTKKGEIERAAKWEIDAQIPISADDAYLKIRNDGFEKRFCKLTVGAVPRNQINCWHFLGGKLLGVIPTVVSLVPVGLPAISKDLSYCYVYREVGCLYIGFYNSDGLQYSHAIATSSAEMNYGLDSSSIDSGPIVDELAKSIEVFYNRFPKMKVAGIILYLPPQEITELIPFIKDSIVIEVLPVDPFENLVFRDGMTWEDDPSKYIPLIGAFKTRESDFRYLPKTLEDNILNRTIRRLVTYCAIGGVLILSTLFLLWMAGLKIKESKLNNALIQKTEIENSEAYKTGRELLARTNHIVSLKKLFDYNDSNISNLYIAIGNMTPRNIYLENLTLNSGNDPVQLEISGYFTGDRSKGDVAILSFMENLRAYGLEKTKLERFGQKLSGRIKTENFKIRGILKENE